MDQHGGVVVTLADIYSAQQEMAVKLAEIGGAIALQSAQDRNDSATLADHENRIRKVEAKVYALPSVATLISAAALLWAVFGR